MPPYTIRKLVVHNLHGLGSTTKCVYLRWIRKSSSHEIHPKSVPLYRLSDARPLPGSKLPVRWSLPRSQHGPSSWFHTTSTVYSAQRPAGLLRPASGSGVRYVSMSCRPPECRSTLMDERYMSPQRFSHPSKNSLVSSRSTSLQPLPSCCYFPLHTA